MEARKISLPFEVGSFQAFSRPSVIYRPDSGCEMWFSYRAGSGDKYRIGYSYSRDGRDWTISITNVGIDVSDSGWDSEMICHPFVFDHKENRPVLYNRSTMGKLVLVWQF